MTTEDNVIKLDLPAEARYLSILSNVIEMYLEQVPDVADGDMTVYNLQLAAQECCTNIIDHAYGGMSGGRIQVSLTIQHEPPRSIILEFWDTGAAIEPTAVAEPELRVGSVRGYGLFLMHELMDEVNYGHEPSGNRWQLVKRI